MGARNWIEYRKGGKRIVRSERKGWIDKENEREKGKSERRTERTVVKDRPIERAGGKETARTSGGSSSR